MGGNKKHMEKIFKLKENGTNVRTELMAGLTIKLGIAAVKGLPGSVKPRRNEVAGATVATAATPATPAPVSCAPVGRTIVRPDGRYARTRSRSR